MKKFGFGKKEKSERDDGDSIRSGLFGRKKTTPSQDENPYAQQPAEDPYARMTPYQHARTDLAAGPRGPPAGLPTGPSPSNSYGTPPPSYSAPAQEKSGYQPQRYGASGGYGGNRYDVGPSTSGLNRTGASPAPSYGTPRVSARGPGGYGGLGPAEENHIKDELLAGATGKYVGQGPPAPSYKPENSGSGLSNTAENNAGGYGFSGGYGEQRELTAEELEEQEYQDIRSQGLQMKRDDVSSLQRTLQIAANTLELADGTTARLNEQEDMLRNTEKNLDTARIHTKIADEKTRELKTLNRSMFAFHAKNPFTSSKREEEAIQAYLQSYQEDTEIGGKTRAERYKSEQERMRQGKVLNAPTRPFGVTQQPSQRERKFMFDDEDEEEGQLEDELGELINMAGGAVTQLHQKAVGMGQSLERQNPLIDRLADKSTDVDIGLAKTRAVMNRIR